MRKDFILAILISAVLITTACAAMYLGDIFTYTTTEDIIVSQYNNGVITSPGDVK